jgi:hypothetical protein
MRARRSRYLWVTPLPLLLFGIGGQAWARAPASVSIPSTYKDGVDAFRAQRCAALFGDHELRARYSSQRARRLDWVHEDENGVTVAHMEESWEEPVRLKLRGVRFVGVRGSTALFQVDPKMAGAVGCQGGIYALGIDHALGRHVRVLAVLRRGVLVEHHGQLGFIAAQGVRDPRWLVAWRLRAEVPLARGPVAPAPRSYRYRR